MVVLHGDGGNESEHADEKCFQCKNLANKSFD